MMHATPAQLALLWRPFFPPTLIAAAGLLLAGLAIYACIRAFPAKPMVSVCMAMMRLALIAILVALLMGPSVMPPVTLHPGRPHVTFLLDTSSSMQTEDADSQARARYAAERWLNQDHLNELRNEFDVALMGFDGRPITLAPEHLALPIDQLAPGRVSHIAASVIDVLSGQGKAGDGSALVLISDGRDSQAEPFQAAARLAQAKAIPVHTVTLGGASVQRDLSLVALPRQPYLLAGEEGKITVRVNQVNAEHAATTLTIKQGDTTEQRAIRFNESDSVSIELPVLHKDAGSYEYSFKVDAVPGEIEPANNEQSVFIDVTDERLNILVLDGEPYWDTKFIAHSLRTDERISVTQITTIAPQRTETILTRVEEDKQPRVPRTLDEMAQYDVIVLGKGLEHVLGVKAAALLPRYVSEHGGRVIFARGRPYDPGTPPGRDVGKALSVIEPVVWGRGVLHDQSLAIDPTGLSHPGFLGAGGDLGMDQLIDRLPPFNVLPVIEREKPSARVLARARPAGASGHAGQPAVVTMPYNRGMVVAILGEGMWRWRLIGREQADLAGVYDRFWSSTVRWLALGSEYQPGQAVALRLEQRSVQVGQEMSFDLVSRAPLDVAAMDALITEPDGTQHHAALRSLAGSHMRYRAAFPVTQTGVHTITVTGPAAEEHPLTARFNAFLLDTERLFCSSNPTAMKVLAEQSGGSVLDPARPQRLSQLLERHRAAAIAPPKPQYAWDRGLFMVMILCWAGGEWLIRKLGGLL